MDELLKIDIVINAKADDKLREELEGRFLNKQPYFDLTNNYVEIGENIHISADKDGKQTARVENVLKAVVECLFQGHKNEYRRKERNKFLNDIQAIKEYLNSPGNQ